jgi:magnesium transporter
MAAIDQTRPDADELREAWSLLPRDDRAEGFRLLPPPEAEEFFLDLTALDQYELITALSQSERRLWLRLLAPDDAADVIQQADEDEREPLLRLLDNSTRREVNALLAYEEDEAGGLMSSRFARVRPDMTIDEAVSYLRRQALGETDVETFYYVYVLDSAQKLLGVLSFREIFSQRGNRTIREVMTTDFVAANDELDQEEVARMFADHDVVALPVIDDEGKMVGIVTVDDIVDVVQEEVTEDVQKYGGMEALEEPYMRTSFMELMKKRAGWLALLAVGELFTATALGFFESELHKATVLTLFIPLIISSGGNSGSQASTLVIRAMTMGEVRLRDWWRVGRRELMAGLALGAILGLIGFLRIIGWQAMGLSDYDHHVLVALTVGVSLVGVVLVGTMAGSMLPFALRRVGFDPASASAPLVATLVDVTRRRDRPRDLLHRCDHSAARHAALARRRSGKLEHAVPLLFRNGLHRHARHFHEAHLRQHRVSLQLREGQRPLQGFYRLDIHDDALRGFRILARPICNLGHAHDRLVGRCVVNENAIARLGGAQIVLRARILDPIPHRVAVLLELGPAEILGIGEKHPQLAHCATSSQQRLISASVNV